jgi:outer membrane protein assembly factor BamE (lipoprotein component of BamABCDE complex)
MKLNMQLSRVAVGASLVLGLVAAHAAKGYNVVEGQGNQIQEGMSSSQVEAILGKPSRIFNFRNEPGPVWSYNVVDMSPLFDETQTVLEVDFGPNGRVVSVMRRDLPNVGDGG